MRLNANVWGVVLVAGTCALPACDDGGDDAPDGGITVGRADAGTGTPDAGGAVCNPVANTGCRPDQKCSRLIESEDPLLDRTGCVPDGTVDLGGTCTQGEPGAVTGYDDCKAGGVCVDEVCTEICSQAPDSCSTDTDVCVPFSRIFDELDGVGLCQPTCDVLAQDCANDESCFISLTTGISSCAPSLADPDTAATEPGGQGDACNYLNTCRKGYGCTLLNMPQNATGLECAYFCDAAGAGGPTCAASPGPGPAYTCVQINMFYSDAPNVPDEIGFCVDPEEWGLGQ